MITIEIEKENLEKVIIKYYELCGIKARRVRFNTKEYFDYNASTDIVVDTEFELMGEKVYTSTTIDYELLHEIVSFALPHLDVDNVEMDYTNESYRGECYKEFCGIKVKAKMNNKIYKKESGINGN